MVITLIHALIGAGGYLLVGAVAVGSADAGVPGSTGLSLIAFVVDYVLLQPIAFWVVEGLAIRWWTPAGASALLGVCVLNSALVCAVIYGLVQRRRAGIGRVDA